MDTWHNASCDVLTCPSVPVTSSATKSRTLSESDNHNASLLGLHFSFVLVSPTPFVFVDGLCKFGGAGRVGRQSRRGGRTGVRNHGKHCFSREEALTLLTLLRVSAYCTLVILLSVSNGHSPQGPVRKGYIRSLAGLAARKAPGDKGAPPAGKNRFFQRNLNYWNYYSRCR